MVWQSGPEALGTPAPRKRAPKGDLYRFEAPPAAEVSEPAPWTKRFLLLRLLARDNGASMEEIRSVCEWNATEAYLGIRALNTSNGYGLRVFRGKTLRTYVKGGNRR